MQSVLLLSRRSRDHITSVATKLRPGQPRDKVLLNSKTSRLALGSPDLMREAAHLFRLVLRLKDESKDTFFPPWNFMACIGATRTVGPRRASPATLTQHSMPICYVAWRQPPWQLLSEVFSFGTLLESNSLETPWVRTLWQLIKNFN
jgi:hypothetical protein